MKTDTDPKILVERCCKGDSKAQFQLFQMYAKQMYNVAYRITNNNFEAEDAVQEAFIKAFQKIRSFKGESTFGAWLKRIVVNQSITALRKNKFQFNSIDEIELSDEEDEVDEKLPLNVVYDAINNLPEGARVVFTLKAIEGYKFREIAQVLNLSESNCKVQYHRSKKLLISKLKPVFKEG